MKHDLRLLFKYAIRNLLRQKRRSFLTTGTVALSCFVSLVGLQYAKAGMKIWKDGLIEFGTGHLQVLTEVMHQSSKPMRKEFLIPKDNVVEKALRKDPEVAAFSQRLRFEGTLSTGKKSVFFLGMGIDTNAEKRVSPKLFDPKLYQGGPLTAEEKKGVILGRLLAETLDVGPGEHATILTRSLDGQINSYDVVVTGILDTPLVELSKRMIYMNLEPVRDILVAQSSSSLAVKLNENVDIGAFSKKYKEISEGSGLLTLTWYELNPSVFKFEGVLQGLVGFICVLLFLSAGNSVLNVIFLSVDERTVEIGTLMAVGITRSKIVALLVAESLAIAVFGVLLGIGSATALLLVLNHVGVGFANPFAAGEIVLYPEPWTWNVVIIVASAIIVCVAAVILPAHRATRVEPIVAMRGIL